ncbi:MAG: DUF4159 domain-containing protein [candidate division WOR-3 bacterium]|jgi:hypothetical protein|nr:DUF4159 domain-containing protein [candidate division WOR-3 bacterium]MCR4423749.1 DUF4159 domain-containing protein [candidate division WOR-3 bacterium]MDH7519088.1 DUF4159 domain-containing protein [bacterium]
MTCLLLILTLSGQFQIARLKYGGGGDWYNDPELIPNLCQEVNRRTSIKMSTDEAQVSLLDEKLYQYPFLFMTGHGNVSFTDDEVVRLRHYLETGGFLYADDDYGMDESFRREMKKVFPNSDLVELPFDHPIYHSFYDFFEGPPKIHEHYEGPPRGYGIFVRGRLVVFYTYNSNVSDGWTDRYNDPPEKREQALRMGINIIAWFVAN